MKSLLLIFISFSFVQAQTSQIKKIDSLIFKEASRLRSKAQYKELIPLGNQIIQLSKAIDYTKGEAWGYSRLGNAYCTLGNYSESLKALDKAKTISKDVDDFRLKAFIALELGRNYNESDVSKDQAIEQFKLGEGFAKKIKDQYDRETYLLYSYENLAAVYSQINKNELAIPYAWKAKHIEENAYILSFLTFYHIKENKNNDSIEFYLNKSTSFLDKNPTFTFEKTILNNQWGKYHEDKKNYKEAVNYYSKAEKLGLETKAMDEVLKTYLGLSRSYEKLNDYKLTVKYERKFSRLQDSLTKAKSKSINSSVNQIVKDKNELHEGETSLLKKVAIGVFIIALIIFLIFIRNIIFAKQQRKKTTELLTEKETIISKKEEETQELKLKINESIEEIVQLAKDNSPEFWGRFQEVYPDFRGKLLATNPDLKYSELILCAYIYLGFNTKDIAEYTFKAIKTIKNNKYNLRKRLGIETKDDFVIWIRNKVDS
ncbi:tetratricopeptide repeat protein [Epilithonimonas xixisoli]|uniref:Tetratricopeptide repeat protein n=1 Tax=Epilithonimonas xixisoli TaxID=1476462 RepID=A0A4R8I9A3_9FLAO|nr:tetratricopeptide repeat protein [Epilithonimonas xixisoli]TDX83232.1 tetratricopeptide repeat protein [Epilithonimonas xixisoli]